MAKDFSNLKSYQDNPNQIVALTSSTGGQIGAPEDSVSYADANAVQSDMTTNPADSRAKNRTHIVYLKPADASQNDAQSYSGDPIIEAGLRSRSEAQDVLKKVLKSSQPSGAMNKSTSEGPMVEWDQEQ